MDVNTNTKGDTTGTDMKPYSNSQSVKPMSTKGATIGENPKPVGKTSAPHQMGGMTGANGMY